MSLKNSFHTQLAIGILLNDENGLEAKLDLLTAIEIETGNEETMRICEEFRERLCRTEEMAQGREELLSSSEADRIYKRDLRNEEPNEVHEGE